MEKDAEAPGIYSEKYRVILLGKILSCAKFFLSPLFIKIKPFKQDADRVGKNYLTWSRVAGYILKLYYRNYCLWSIFP